MQRKSLLLPVLLVAATTLAAQDNVPPLTPPDSQATQPYERPVSLGKLIPNIGQDQARIWLFPTKVFKNRNWIPVAVILGTTAALIAADPHDAPYFRKTSTFSGFNSVFTGTATGVGIAVPPVALYVTGLVTKDSKMQGTALLAGEAVADSEILAYVLESRVQVEYAPASLPPQNANFPDTFFESPGCSYFRSNGGMPSGKHHRCRFRSPP